MSETTPAEVSSNVATITPSVVSNEPSTQDLADMDKKREGFRSKIKDPKFVADLLIIVLQTAIIIFLLQSCESGEKLQSEQSKINIAIAEYVTADKVVAEQVVKNKCGLESQKESLSSCEAKLAALEEEVKKIETFSSALTKVNRLAIMNRNRIYSILMKDDPQVPEAFREDTLEADEIDKYSRDLALAMSKAIEENKSNKEDNVAEKEVSNKEVSVDFLCDESENKSKERPIEKTPSPEKNVSVDRPKKDYFLFLKPWKWF